jgi:hypothetical protein
MGNTAARAAVVIDLKSYLLMRQTIVSIQGEWKHTPGL